MVARALEIERRQETKGAGIPNIRRKGVIRLGPDDYGDIGWVLEQLGIVVEKRGYTLPERLNNIFRRLPDSPKISQTPSWAQDLDI